MTENKVCQSVPACTMSSPQYGERNQQMPEPLGYGMNKGGKQEKRANHQNEESPIKDTRD